MPSYLSPVGNEVQTDANGNPLVGGQIFTYQAGTTTPIATYTGSDAGTAQANPIVLNSAGLPDSPIWLPAGQAVKLVFKDADNVDYRPAADNITGINDPSTTNTVDQWVTFSGAPTYISATSFSLAGDQTNTFQVGRRVKSTNTGGTVYSTISASSYNAGTGLTTVTVRDSGSLDSGLSIVSYGLLSATNPSTPALSGQVLQEVVYTDAGSTTSSSSFANVTASVKNITPKSSNSTLLIEVTFQGNVTAGGAGTNTQGTFQLFNNTAAANIGGAYTQSVQSGTGANLQADGAMVVRATVANSALTTLGFTLRAKYSTVTAATVSATSQVWTIREIQN